MSHKLSKKVTDAIVACASRGMSRDETIAALKKQGVFVSAGSISNTLTAARGKKAPPSRPRAPDAPVLEPIPEDGDIAQLDRWIERAERLAVAAENDGDLSGFAAVQRLLNAALAQRTKLRPPAKADPNEDPNMIALGQAAAKKLHKLLEDALKEPT